MTDTTAVVPAADNSGWKGLVNTIWQRVFLSYKTTLLGIAIGALGIVADSFAQSPNKVLTIIGGVLAWALTFYKQPAASGTLVK